MMDAASPRYQRVKDHILTRIQSGELRPGMRVPSENEIVTALNVSRMTANRALRELTDQGFLARVPGVGTFVKEQQARASLMELKNIADEITARGHIHSAEIILNEKAEAKPSVAEAFGQPIGTHFHHLQILHRENGLPVQLEDRYVDEAVAPGFSAQDFTKITPTQWLLAAVPVDELEHTVEAVVPKPRKARLLEIDKGEPCLSLYRRSFSQGRVVTVVTLLYPASRYALHSRYSTSPQGRITP
ncbi:MAG: histidine utilization repressor [Aestuariivirgaceae bacterium]|nr:histidine utilization repressor [Aestuariivirgaceae bacterium]